MAAIALALDDGELSFQSEGDGLRVFCSVDERGNYVSHLLSLADVVELRRWLNELAEAEGVYCLAARLGGPDHQPYLCQRDNGHEPPHRVEKGDWSHEW